MASSLAHRILAISIIIALCSPLTSGFTLQRTETAPITQAHQTQLTTDLTSEESVQLQVKDLTRTPNDISNDKDSWTGKQEVVTLHVIKNEVITPTPEVSITEIRLPDSIEKTVSENTNDVNTIITTDQSVSNKSEPINQNASYTDIISEHLIKEINDAISVLTEIPTDTTVISTNTDQDITVTSTNTDQVAIDTETTVDLTTEKHSSDSQTDTTTQTNETPENKIENTTTDSNTETISELQSVDEIISRNISENDKPKETVSQSNNDIDTTTYFTSNDNEQITTEPSWKKYVTIDRKRSSTEDLATESTVNDYMFYPTERVPSLFAPPPESLDLQPENNHQITSTSDQDTTTIENKFTENDRIVSSIKTDDKRLINYSIDTKRAGFLDYSKTSPHEDITSTTELNEPNEPQSTKRPETVQSHSDLTDDAIKEELLREEIINNEKQNQDNIRLNNKDYHFESTVHPSEGTPSTESDDDVSSRNITPLPSYSTEDALSVQPIHHDRRTTLYTISPNYKPMKKIDVQPPKPFVRDPDDNSWRNESISSLGIVFKPKNASKSFKEVLKNKTETEFNMLLDSKDSKNEVPDLRLRLEKIAEVRKSKKKKTNKAGDVVYIDYEENGSAEGTTSKINTNLDTYSSTTAAPETTTQNMYHKTSSEIDDFFKKFEKEVATKKFENEDNLTSDKPKKFYNEYYDTTDEDEDYVTLPNIDLKKYTRFSITDLTPSTVMRHHTPAPFTPTAPVQKRFPSFPERKPTVDYFPPRTTTPKVNIDQYDDDFQKKVNYYTSKETTHEFIYPTEPIATDRPTTQRPPAKSIQFPAYPRTISPPKLSSPHGFVPNEGNFNRGSYVIKHYRDILRDAVKSNDDVEDFGYIDATRPQPLPDNQRLSEDEERSHTPGTGKVDPDYMDYDTQFRKDVLNRFVENFNQNSERYKIDFPILYNNSIVHQKYDDQGRVSASSTTFVKGVYGHHSHSGPIRTERTSGGRNCEPHCDLAVELSPAYELHYYVPDQEEKEQVSAPYSFKV